MGFSIFQPVPAFSLGRTLNWTKAGACGGNSRSSWVCKLYFDRIHDIYWARVRVVAGVEQSEWASSSELQLYRDSKDWGAPPAGLFWVPVGRGVLGEI